ncbi:MAG: fibrobacter succinogenes major paralogous domain-containing protein [Bacteroidales bacterium]|nr:fibrobacter succinogenes major paralogous domain-containing protein [Bacteroidales bacterium]
MKLFSAFCLPALVMAGALLLFASCKKENPAPAPDPTPTSIDLSASGTANCYIVSAPGTYSFKVVKGNSDKTWPNVAQAEVLWESFGTDEVPDKGAIISSVSYADGRVTFSTPGTLKNGNAVVAVKYSNETICWSWHIWVCKGYDPDDARQVYYKNAGTMMDRNLGATSATPGEAGSLGLLYQWGRKDPFLGSSSISSNTLTASTITWPAAQSAVNYGTVNTSISHPTLFIYPSSTQTDWIYNGPDNTLWAAEKTIYDPCPTGWKVPVGGENGVWATALDNYSAFSWTFDTTQKGMNFSGKFGDAASIWYPASGYRYEKDGRLLEVGLRANSWTSTPEDKSASTLYMYYKDGHGTVFPKREFSRAAGYSVRCVKE